MKPCHVDSMHLTKQLRLGCSHAELLPVATRIPTNTLSYTPAMSKPSAVVLHDGVLRGLSIHLITVPLGAVMMSRPTQLLQTAAWTDPSNPTSMHLLLCSCAPLHQTLPPDLPVECTANHTTMHTPQQQAAEHYLHRYDEPPSFTVRRSRPEHTQP